MLKLATFVVAGAALSVSAQAQTYLMMPDSTNGRVVLFSPADGSVANGSYFPIATGVTQVHAMQVGGEIWISEQLGDKVSRFDLTGAPLGTITGGMDNLRGMGMVGDTVYVTNAGTANGAPGGALLKFAADGTSQGFFLTPNAPSPFGVLPYEGAMLVSSSSANDDIHKYATDGTSLGTFHNSASLSFVEQLAYTSRGEVLAAVFTTGVIAKLDPATGTIISTFAAPGARGVHELENGNVLWTSGSGAYVFDSNTGGSTQVYAGGGRYLDVLTLGGGCDADFNGDNQVDFFDYLDFVAAFDAEDPAADFNGDNQVDFFDYLDFAAAFDACQ